MTQAPKPQRYTLDDAMASRPQALNGNSAWGQRYAGQIRRIVTDHAMRAPRNVQRHLGPSELGVECDLQVVMKLLGYAHTNHVVDPWPSIVGTAVHAWLADCFTAHNNRVGTLRFLAEQRVTPLDGHSGTADLYDALELAVVDHKVLGESSMAKVRRDPSRKYKAQLLLYALGYRRLGLPVRRVALVAYPRTTSSLNGIYVWERPASAADDELISEVLEDTARRKQLVADIIASRKRLDQVEMRPDDEECYFCPFYRPDVTERGGPGCPGTKGA
jgi:hypothetical protein